LKEKKNNKIKKTNKMEKVRAKFTCNGINDNPLNEYKSVTFTPVISGSEENKSFSKYTPSGSITMNISYETLASDFFTEGEEFYIDFTRTV
jgi:hypothetical protein